MRKKTVRKLLLFGISIVALASPCNAGLVSSFFDVGEGESIFLESAGEAALIDTGNVRTGKDVVSKIRQMSFDRLKYLIITHPHPDHMGGVFRVLESLSFERIFDNGQSIERNTNCVLYRWYAETVRVRPHYAILKKGDHLLLGDAQLDVLWPEAGFRGGWNESSLVIRIRGREKRILLMGDVPKRVETRLIKTYHDDLHAQVLKIGHHGADDATSTDFLRAVRPETAVISTNRNNVNGYPSPETIRRIENQGIRIYKTYEDGDIVIR
jgi:competence protein ComEC